MHLNALLTRLRTGARRLRRDRSGLAMLEFAFGTPLVLGLGLYGVESANLALVNLRVSQIALALADNASRVGDSSLSTQQLREVDVNDILQAARYQGQSIDLTNRGRIILSSLENVQQSYDASGPVQRIHWQRCLGKRGDPRLGATETAYRSSYGTALPLATAGTDATQANAGTTAAAGMGDGPSSMVTAPAGSAVMFVEVNYNYKPLVSGYLLGSSTQLHYIASFIVRDPRDFTRLYNPTATPATVASTCDKYTA